MKLEQILKRITPLPWDEKTPFPVQGKEFWANQSYRRHAANVLPELIEAVKNDLNGRHSHEQLARALARAEEVRDL
jgi:hypothetical protein